MDSGFVQTLKRTVSLRNMGFWLSRELADISTQFPVQYWQLKAHLDALLKTRKTIILPGEIKLKDRYLRIKSGCSNFQYMESLSQDLPVMYSGSVPRPARSLIKLKLPGSFGPMLYIAVLSSDPPCEHLVIEYLETDSKKLYHICKDNLNADKKLRRLNLCSIETRHVTAWY